jgi:hypothetical protein
LPSGAPWRNRRRAERERKEGRNEKADRKDADEQGQTESKDRGITSKAHSQKDGEGKANGWGWEAGISTDHIKKPDVFARLQAAVKKEQPV